MYFHEKIILLRENPGHRGRAITVHNATSSPVDMTRNTPPLDHPAGTSVISS